MTNNKFFHEYLSKLEMFKQNIPLIVDDSGVIKINEETPIELVELRNYLSLNFDKFSKILKSTNFEEFPWKFTQLVGGYNQRIGGYLSSSDYVKLQNEVMVLDSRLRRNFRRKFLPHYWMKKFTKWLLMLPYNFIAMMGFDPEEFIKTPIGQALAVMLIIAFLILIGFSVDQIAEIIKAFA